MIRHIMDNDLNEHEYDYEYDNSIHIILGLSLE